MFDFTPIHLSTTYAPATAEEIAAFSALGQDLAARCATAHPYLHASEDIFARLSAAYRDESAPLHESVASYIDRAQAITAKEAYALNDTGDALRTPIVNPYEDGFDVGGRLGVATHTGQMLPLAFAYRVTGDEAYARLAYLIGRDMIAWEHWCEGHFLNCADGASPFAVAYDWLCGPWRTIGLDPTPLCIGLFERAIVPGYDSVIFEPHWATFGVTDGCWMYTTESGDLLMLWSNNDEFGYCVGVARSSNGRLDGEWIHEDLLYARSMTVENRYDGGHGMIFTDRDGQMYLSFHSPNSKVGDRSETAVFLAIREENNRLVWDEPKPAHN